MHRDAARRTLVADGDKDRALAVRSMLSEHGRHVDLTASFADALSLLGQRQHESLVLSLTEAGGIAGVRAACDRRPGLAVIVLADEDDPALESAVLGVGAQDYLTSSTIAQLPAIVERSIARARVVERLHASEVRYRAIIEELPGFIAITFDEQLRVTNLDGQGSRIADHTLDYVGQPVAEVGEELMDRFGPCWHRALEGERFTVEATEDANGHSYVTYFAPMHDAGGRQIGGMAVGLDVDDRVKAESTLASYRRRHIQRAEDVGVGIAEFDVQEATALFTAAFEHAPVGMGIFSVDGRYQQVNPALCQLLGRTADEIIGRRADDFIEPDQRATALHALDELVGGRIDEWESEGCLVRPDGSPVWTLLCTTVLRGEDGEPTLLFTQMVDIGKRRNHEAELRHLADHDVLTGLVNRRRFEAELARHIVDHAGRDRGGAVLLIDLDRFKSVNDENGHHAGDRVLVDVAEVLRQRLRRTDVVGRIGGDEFAVLLRECDTAQARAVAQMLASAIAETGITASIGAATVEGGDHSAEQVLVRADLAMYEVKRRMRDEALAGQYFNW